MTSKREIGHGDLPYNLPRKNLPLFYEKNTFNKMKKGTFKFFNDEKGFGYSAKYRLGFAS